MSDKRYKHWPGCWLAGLIGFFMMAGSRKKRPIDRAGVDSGEPVFQGTSASVPATDDVSDGAAEGHLDSFRTIASLESNVDPSKSDANSFSNMSSDSNGGRLPVTNNPLKQITIRQWVVALIVLVAVPVGTYFGAYYLYPYVQDQLERESPIDAVLSEYGVAEDAESQLLTIRRGDLVNSVAVNGSLEYANRERLAFGLAGTIESVNVDVGDFVAEGDVLMSLEDDAVVAADQQLQDASVALQNAEQALDDLINPDQKSIDDATLKILEATQSLVDAETRLDDLTNPSVLDIENATLAVAEAEKTLADAESALRDFTYPPQLEVEQSELAVKEAAQAVEDARSTLEDLASLDSSEIAEAEHALNEAVREHEDAVEALSDLLEVDPADINAAELEIENARLALVEAGNAVVDAEKVLKDAEDAIANELDFQLEVAQAEAEVASANLSLIAAEDALKDARLPYTEDDVTELHEKIAEAESDIPVAEDQLKQLVIETDSESRGLEDALKDARDAYQEVFFRWLGMDISIYEWEASPDRIFAHIGKTLPEIITPVGGLNRIAQQNSVSSGLVEDDPNTPWNETVVSTWTQFFLSNLRFDCTEYGTGITDECVNIEFENAWDEVAARTEAWRTFTLANSQKFDSAEDAVDAARNSLDDLEDQLIELLEPTDQEIVEDLSAKIEVADLMYREAQKRLTQLLDEFDVRARGKELDRLTAEQGIEVSVRELKVAEDGVEAAEQNLADLRAGTSDVDLTLAKSRVEKAVAGVADARVALDNLRVLDDEAIEIAEKQLEVAEADLDAKTDAFEILVEPDKVETVVLEQEIDVARSDLQDKIEKLHELTEQDELQIEIARQEIEVARAELSVARVELNDVINPDPATVALRRAEVATAQENLEAAQSGIVGSQIIAPFDGVVSSITAEAGDSVREDTAMVEIADASIVQVSGTVDEVDVLFLQVGDAATIELEALGDEVLVGRISDIAAFGESNQGVVTYPVTIQTEQPSDTQLPEGLSAVAEIIIREQTDQLLVPIQALFGSVNAPILLISRPDGTLEPREVIIGISDDFWTVIETGVSEGETILMTVVGADTSQFGGFRAVRSFTSVGGGPPGGGR